MCVATCEKEWPNCVEFHNGKGKDGCAVCEKELNKEGSRLVKKGKCIVGCELTVNMQGICKNLTGKPTATPSVIPTEVVMANCTENKNDKFFYKFNKKQGKDVTRLCKWLEK